ncbi:hypothetical protein F3J14_14290 [Burkholderia sp. Tr-862]|uniref:hypothetical protein n=1 Tax=Burkholderia sp. Tr-862 TaxID=2608331 RepID=UPI00141A3F1E|nr:hypothetical protein [Burkholderia sp. Tr-862]NIF42034.1 hypothetical protein [Burkholderia sp. Tr-862]
MNSTNVPSECIANAMPLATHKPKIIASNRFPSKRIFTSSFSENPPVSLAKLSLAELRPAFHRWVNERRFLALQLVEIRGDFLPRIRIRENRSLDVVSDKTHQLLVVRGRCAISVLEQEHANIHCAALERFSLNVFHDHSPVVAVLLERRRRVRRIDHSIVGKAFAPGVAQYEANRAIAGCLVGAMHSAADQLLAGLIVEAKNPTARIRAQPPHAIEARIRRVELHFDTCDAHNVGPHSSPHGFAVEETRLPRDHFAIADQS